MREIFSKTLAFTTLGALAVIVATAVRPSALRADAESADRMPAQFATLFEVSRPARLQHAQLLLGKHYSRSVVSVGEQVMDIREFVLAKVKASLPKKHKASAPIVAHTILEESGRYDFDPLFLMAVIQNESSFSPDIVGGVGEIGLMQIRPSTAQWFCDKIKRPWYGVRSLKNPATNIQIGAALLKMFRDKFSHDRLYLSAYNMGIGNVNKALKKDIWPKEYSSRVMNRYVGLYRDLAKRIEKQRLAIKAAAIADL
ncbi:MAG: lytic transglycosylase domain-containing protein [Bacteriovoracia bacterium]